MSECYQRRVWLRSHLFWWTAIDPDEPLGMIDSHTILARAFTREKLIEKLKKRAAKPISKPDEIILCYTGSSGTP